MAGMGSAGLLAGAGRGYPQSVAAGDSALEANLAGGAKASITLLGAADNEARERVMRWMQQSSEAVATYYGRFPVDEVAISARFTNGRGRVNGRAFPSSPPQLQLEIPANAGESALMQDDWVLVHEMVHLAFPHFNRRRHNWLIEGLAVYVEPVARIMAGHMPAEIMWRDFVQMMPRGLPAPGDGGYDVTSNWARTYWGGAIFCLVCDLRIREQTENRAGLHTALRGVNAEFNFSDTGALQDFLAIADKATGTGVMMDAWKEMGPEPVAPDLEFMWANLGVVRNGSGIRLDDSAPLAGIRKSITTA